MSKISEKLREKMIDLEGKLMDYIPEDEVDTERTKVLDEIIEFNSDGYKTATEEELNDLYDKGKSVLAVETERKKTLKKAKKAVKVENEVKKPLKKDQKKSVKKETEPKKETKEEKKEVKEPENLGGEFNFPNELKVEGENGQEVYTLKTIKKLSDIKDTDLIATRWTVEDLANYDYSELEEIEQPDKFEQDIDICTIIDNEGKLLYCQSALTRKVCYFTDKAVNKEMVFRDLPWRVYSLKK